MINEYKEHVRKCVKCSTIVWISDDVLHKFENGKIKEVFCTDCMIRKKLKERKVFVPKED